MKLLVRAFALLTLGVIAGWSAPTGALAQDAWREIATHPFTGSPEEVCRLHAAQGNLAYEACMRGVAMQQAGQCQSRFLRDGETLHVSFTRDGVHGIEHKRVAFGQSVLSDDPRRAAYDCDLGDGQRLVLPVTCGNWSVPSRIATPRPQPPAPPRVIVRETYLPGSYFNVEGIHVHDAYCGHDIDIPGVSGMTPGAVQKSTTIIIDGH